MDALRITGLYKSFKDFALEDVNLTLPFDRTRLVLVISLVLPFIYRFGAEKGRLVLMAVVLVPFVIYVLMENMELHVQAEAIGKFFQALDKAPWLLFVAAAVLVLGSIFISIQICKKKEY